MLNLVSIELSTVPQGILAQGDEITFFCTLAGGEVAGDIKEIHCSLDHVSVLVKCNFHDFNHEIPVDDVWQNYTQNWLIDKEKDQCHSI